LSTGGLCSRIGCDNDGMSLITFATVWMLPSGNVLMCIRKAIVLQVGSNAGQEPLLDKGCELLSPYF